VVVVERARPPGGGHLHAADRFIAQARSATEPEYQLSVIVGLMSELWDSLETLFFREILGHHLAHVLELVEARIEQAKTPYGVGDVAVVQRLVAPKGFECQFALAAGKEEGMALGMPEVANCKNPIGYRSHP
jgi:hypothetical protein